MEVGWSGRRRWVGRGGGELVGVEVGWSVGAEEVGSVGAEVDGVGVEVKRVLLCAGGCSLSCDCFWRERVH